MLGGSRPSPQHARSSKPTRLYGAHLIHDLTLAERARRFGKVPPISRGGKGERQNGPDPSRCTEYPKRTPRGGPGAATLRGTREEPGWAKPRARQISRAHKPNRGAAAPITSHVAWRGKIARNEICLPSLRTRPHWRTLCLTCYTSSRLGGKNKHLWGATASRREI